MYNIEDITLMFNGSDGKVVFLVPNAIVFNDADEFCFFLDGLKEEIGSYGKHDCDGGESDIEKNYAEEVIIEWQQELASSEMSGQKKQNPEP